LACIDRFAQLAAHDEAAPQRAAAIRRLGLLDATQKSQTVVAALGDDDGEVRLAATEVLGRFGGRGAVDALVARNTKEPEPDVRCGIARSLGRIGGEDAATHLGLMLAAEGECSNDPAPTPVPIALVAAQALEDTETRGAVPALIESLSDPRPTVRVAAAQALRKLTNRVDESDWADAGAPVSL